MNKIFAKESDDPLYDAIQTVRRNVLSPLQDFYGELPMRQGASKEAIIRRWADALKDFAPDSMEKAVEKVILTHEGQYWPTLPFVFRACFDAQYPHGKMSANGLVQP